MTDLHGPQGERRAERGGEGAPRVILGVAYKRDINDLRERPALEVMRLLQEKGAEVVYHDPHCPGIRDDGHTSLQGLPMRSQLLNEVLLATADAVVLVTDHSEVDYVRVAQRARLVVDTRQIERPQDKGGARVIGLSYRPAAATSQSVYTQAC